ncbi:MAG: methyl-accepting chemotaxis protein [Elusimicrobia bacterium]|nr:methyl-accepting chemotaxis protein [Elusimicrobiota bacterium]
MTKLIERLRGLYVDPELQFRFVIFLVVLIMVESVFVGRGLVALVFMARDWRRPDLLFDFFLSLLWLLAPLLAVNVGLGLYWSARIARPLKALDKGLKDLREGHFSPIEDLRPRDALKDLSQNFNETVGRLKYLLTRDRRLVLEALADLDQAQAAKPGDREKFLLQAKSKLSIVNAHFHKDGSNG